MWILLGSPMTVAPYQTLHSSPRKTSPVTLAVGATQLSYIKIGLFSTPASWPVIASSSDADWYARRTRRPDHRARTQTRDNILLLFCGSRLVKVSTQQTTTIQKRQRLTRRHRRRARRRSPRPSIVVLLVAAPDLLVVAMVLLEPEKFLSELTRLFESTRDKGSLSITHKRGAKHRRSSRKKQRCCSQSRRKTRTWPTTTLRGIAASSVRAPRRKRSPRWCVPLLVVAMTSLLSRSRPKTYSNSRRASRPSSKYPPPP